MLLLLLMMLNGINGRRLLRVGRRREVGRMMNHNLLLLQLMLWNDHLAPAGSAGRHEHVDLLLLAHRRGAHCGHKAHGLLLLLLDGELALLLLLGVDDGNLVLLLLGDEALLLLLLLSGLQIARVRGRLVHLDGGAQMLLEDLHFLLR